MSITNKCLDPAEPTASWVAGTADVHVFGNREAMSDAAATALFCAVPGARKRLAVKAALEGPETTACPASILQTHPACSLFLDNEANPDG